MAEIYGSTLSRADLLARVGDISQIARVKPYRLIEGREDGMQAIDVTTGSGLDFTILPGRGMDISSAHFNGRSLAWRSATSDAHPAYFDHEGENGRGWLRSFYGGLVVTCGLTYAGAGGEDEGRHYGIHGRISNLPAYAVSYDAHWDGDEYLLSVTGKMREATVFGENLELTRTISTSLGSRSFRIYDVVENLGYKRTEHMMLYHINLGYPIVADHSRLIAPTLTATPRDADAEEGRERYAECERPQAGFREKVYFHEFPAKFDRISVAIVNPEIETGLDHGLGVRCTYSPRQLPRFIEWKMMDAGTYVVGLEPANCLVMGRRREREAGTLQYLEPGEKREYALEIDVMVGSSEIEEMETFCREATARG